MSESIDFKQIALEIRMLAHMRDPSSAGLSVNECIVKRLHQVWNARGAADIIAIDEVGYLVTAIQELDC